MNTPPACPASSGQSLMEPEFQCGNYHCEAETRSAKFDLPKETLMKNLGRVAVVVVALLATFVGIKYAKEESRVEVAQASIENVKEAEWVRVEGNEFLTAYAAPATIRRTGDRVQMQALVNFKTVNASGGHPHLSTKTQHEYDCKENQWRLIYFSYHSGNMGGGELVYSDDELGQWEPVKIGSGTQIRWKLACGKR